MTEQDILIKDLCARLPYGVKAHTLLGTNITLSGVLWNDTIMDETGDKYDISFIKLYLRPMSSMTEEEGDELRTLIDENYEIESSDTEVAKLCVYVQDWLSSHQFDYRDLIKKDLALEAPEGMYNI